MSRALGMFPDGLPIWLDAPDDKSWCAAATSTPTSGVTKGPDENSPMDWQRLMGQFTVCRLTFSTDELIALEGIARNTM